MRVWTFFTVYLFCPTGKRVSKIVDSIAMAKKFESKLKTQAVEKTLLGVSEVPTIDEIWENYLDWAKKFKKSWHKDYQRWQMHVQPHLSGKRMGTVAAYDVKGNRQYESQKRPCSGNDQTCGCPYQEGLQLGH